MYSDLISGEDKVSSCAVPKIKLYKILKIKKIKNFKHVKPKKFGSFVSCESVIGKDIHLVIVT